MLYFIHKFVLPISKTLKHLKKHLNILYFLTFLQEAFHAAKSAFNRYRTKVFSALQDTHTGPESLSDAVQKYINKNGQLLDVHSIVEVG